MKTNSTMLAIDAQKREEVRDAIRLCSDLLEAIGAEKRLLEGQGAFSIHVEDVARKSTLLVAVAARLAVLGQVKDSEIRAKRMAQRKA